MKRILSIAVLVLITTLAYSQKKPVAKKAKAKTTTQKTVAKKKAPAKKSVAPVAVVPIDTVKAPVKIAKKKPYKAPPKDGFYTRTDIDSTVMVPLVDVREEDIFYAKRVWREIDLRDTINSVLKSPKSRLIDVIIDAVKAEELTAYSPFDTLNVDNDNFQFALEADSAYKMALGTVEISDSKTGMVRSVVNDYNPTVFQKYRIKEDWILDVKRSIFEPRIVGLAPLKFVESSKQWQPVFWINYPEARVILAKKRLVNVTNDASVLSFDDFFLRRLFSSYIVKESNPGDEKLRDYITDPRERLLESERIKRSVLDYEQGLWQY